MRNNAVVQVQRPVVDRLRSAWLRYHDAKWGWHIAVPIGLGAVAAAVLGWAWNVLSQDEYGVAMLLTLFFVILGFGASLAITKNIVRVITIMVVILIGLIQGLLFTKRKVRV